MATRLPHFIRKKRGSGSFRSNATLPSEQPPKLQSAAAPCQAIGMASFLRPRRNDAAGRHKTNNEKSCWQTVTRCPQPASRLQKNEDQASERTQESSTCNDNNRQTNSKNAGPKLRKNKTDRYNRLNAVVDVRPTAMVAMKSSGAKPCCIRIVCKTTANLLR